MKSLLTNLQRLSLALLAVIVVVFGSFTVLIPTASATIDVENFSYRVTENDIDQLFSEYGDVKRVQILTERETGRSKGCAFVDMATEAEEMAAIEALDGTVRMGRYLKVRKTKIENNSSFRNRERGCFDRSTLFNEEE